MPKLIECVPNFSEGRDLKKINCIVGEMASVPDIKILNIQSGFDANRSVVTIVGSPESVLDAAFLGIKKAAEVIDMENHNGKHPCIGATDVFPIVPISGISELECIELSRTIGKRVGDELNIPVYLYEKSAENLLRKDLSKIREGGYKGLNKKMKNNRWSPDFGPPHPHPKAGATIIGCREILIAYNINLNTTDHMLAMDIACDLRESGRVKRILHPNSLNFLDGEIVRKSDGSPVLIPGIFKGIKALGWYIAQYNFAQVSINISNYKNTSLHDVFDKTCELAKSRNVDVTGSELIGLIPLDAMVLAGKHYIEKKKLAKNAKINQILDYAIQYLGLDSIREFDPNKRIIEYTLGLKNN